MQHKGRVYGALICWAMHMSPCLRHRPETKRENIILQYQEDG